MKKESILIIAIVVLALISRFPFLDIRPLHHDEGVNYFFAAKILSGEEYRYDPTNYHGPLYFFLIALSFIIFGVSEFSLRLPAVLFGIALVLIPLFWKRREINPYIVSFLIIISPSLMYYSRYSIHEISFVLFSLIAVYSLTKILEDKNLNKLPLFAISLALLFTIKETVIIMFFILFIIGLINLKRIKEIDFKKERQMIFLSIFLFLLIYALLFTSFFTNIYGIVDSVKGFLPWTDKGIEGAGHEKPFYYFFMLLLKYEWPILFFALFGLYFAYKNKDVFSRNISLMFLLNIIIYSMIPYKTPWLIINITAPMCLLAAIGLKNIRIDKLKNNLKILVSIIILSGLAYLVYFSVNLNFIKPWQAENKFAYVHTDKDILGLIKNIDEAYSPFHRASELNRTKDNSKILMVSDEYWPLPFYLHGKNVSYSSEYLINDEEFQKYDIFIVRDKYFNATEFLSEYELNRYRLREGVELVLAWKEK